ncbi:bifunctional UDP-N-acetylglucosamine diphosphorylase/glucosamine-1-phosphate N-acetyltransferase GlmU [Consotaella salsifontis]|uniref:Bifunctional protein GlmU n=1 Tax=Consotaella salsifontis TaxID=1365950 RepID=A0A1T4TBX2_9HYPH|nr:bifunctional UDP-N-acetylglucosamine diphosphorylase/glucosamine-1-phosphate N-acetyltransferase GlmU [Consotaella salsifontis]SKA37821.1 UDP-N-acetylglucosamine pyrophosphorylase /glucosamine-1-phosphate N-acetyltransferase [Consotaella salsifontis]
MARTCLSIILAAGEGSRMKSRRAKVLHEVAGLAMIRHVAKAAAATGSSHIALVLGRDHEEVEASVQKTQGEGVSTHLQMERLGTAHAVLAARAALEEGWDDVLILYGDTPLIRPETLTRARASLLAGADVCVVGFRPSDPTGYGRLIEGGGELLAIREHKDASDTERLIGYCNSGVMAVRGGVLLDLLEKVGNDNSKGEYYLTDIVAIARAKGQTVRAIEAPADEVAGVNSRVELAYVEALWQSRRRREMMLAGVTLVAPDTVFFSHDTEIAADVVVEPNVVFGPGVSVLAGAVIHAFSHLEGARVGVGCAIGPFARLRPGATLATDAKVGNFCEIKNAEVGEGAKVNHLTYIGDATVGAKSNIGAGTITCNYDGALKHHTEIGAGVFVGSNTALVAPVSVGDGAYIASGSVITENIPADALALGRARQVNKDDRGRLIRERNAAAKAERKRREAEAKEA